MSHFIKPHQIIDNEDIRFNFISSDKIQAELDEMKIVKRILLGIGIFVVVILLIALLVPRKYSVLREITIMAPKAEVFDYIKYLKNQDNYSVWAQMDTNMKKKFTGIDGTVGFTSSWDSEDKDVGTGEQEIIKIIEGERVDFELRFLKPFKATDDAYMSTTEINQTSTLVKWGFDGEMQYPMNLMLLFMSMDKMLGSDLEQGLQQLKLILEK